MIPITSKVLRDSLTPDNPDSFTFNALTTTRGEAYQKTFTEISGVSGALTAADKEVVKDFMEKDYTPQEGVDIARNG